MSRYAFRMDPRSKEVATVQELEEPTEVEWTDDIEELFGRIFTEESDDMIGPDGELDFNQ